MLKMFIATKFIVDYPTTVGQTCVVRYQFVKRFLFYFTKTLKFVHIFVFLNRIKQLENVVHRWYIKQH